MIYLISILAALSIFALAVIFRAYETSPTHTSDEDPIDADELRVRYGFD